MLIERPINFDCRGCGLPENCEQGIEFSSDEYYSTEDTEPFVCHACDRKLTARSSSIVRPHPKVYATKELHQLAWYHTSVEPEWPAVLYRWSAQDEKSFSRFSTQEQFEQIKRSKEDQALHLGTYEAAIEAMLRRMEQRDERHLRFNLYRVELKDGLIFKNEVQKDEFADKITQSELRDMQVEGIQYLNAHESVGSISLAVTRIAIKSTQRISLPVEGLVEDPAPGMLDDLRRIREASDTQLQAIHGRESLSAEIERKLGQTPSRVKAPVSSVRSVPATMSRLVAERYLKGVSPALRKKYCTALSGAGTVGDERADDVWLRLFMNLSAVITCPEEILAALDRTIPQDVVPAS